MNQQTRGDATLLLSLHPRIQGLGRLILTMMVIGVLLDATVKIKDV